MRKFLTGIFTEKEANVIVFGVPMGKSGKAELDSIRKASWYVETYDIDKKINLLENARLFDCGDIKLDSFKEITHKVKSIIGNGKVPLMLGGTHLSSLYSFQGVPKDTKLLIFDAHCDLKDRYMDDKIRDLGTLGGKCVIDNELNDATWLRRLCEIVNPKNIMLLGIRSADEDEINFARESGILFYTPEDIKNRMNEVSLIVHQFTKLSNVYISLDIDVFDPGINPSIDYPEPNGILFQHFQRLVASVAGRISGIDLCCLNPIKGSQITEFLAVKSLFEILSKV